MRFIMKIFIIMLTLLSGISFVHAEEPHHGKKAVEVKISLGTQDGQVKFIPDRLTFERGKYYKLIISNPSSEAHYFTSDAFATHVFTRKVEVLDQTGKAITEIHGDIHDLELQPGAVVRWFFFPMTKGENLRLFCHKRNHEEQGMVGSINIIGDL